MLLFCFSFGPIIFIGVESIQTSAHLGFFNDAPFFSRAYSLLLVCFFFLPNNVFLSPGSCVKVLKAANNS